MLVLGRVRGSSSFKKEHHLVSKPRYVVYTASVSVMNMPSWCILGCPRKLVNGFEPT